MSKFRKIAVDAYGALRALAHGGRQSGGFGESSIASQIFNASSKGHADTVVLFMPGFVSVPNIVSPDPLRKWVHGQGWDFARFYHPQLVSAPDKLRYPDMMHEATAVARALPHRRVVLMGSSFGAGLMPYVAHQVNERQPGRVTGMFGWLAVPPRALRGHILMQPGHRDFAEGRTEHLRVELGLKGRFFTMTHEHHNSICAMAEPPRFNGSVILIAGRDDTVGRPCYSFDLLKTLDAPRSHIVSVNGGHTFPAEQVRAQLPRLKMMLG